MDFSISELNYNSVETIPGFDARAAFTVNSGAVFREDVDIIPTVVDQDLSFMPWGVDNLMPFNIIDLIEKDETLATCQHTLSKVDHTAVCKLQQGPADRNFVRLSNTFIDLLTGQQMTNENATIINMATTERAGAMKAQQVVDLNNTRRALPTSRNFLM